MATRSATTVLHQHVADILTENVGQQPERADELIHMLRTVLGDHAVAVEHIGSTSVPGLAGRPIPGIQVAVLDIADRDTFYTTSQGSRIMPYAWFKALRRLDANEPFAADRLQQYGYLSRPESNLPIGFVIDGDAASGMIGMTCAACHTAQLEYMKDGKTHALRIDGAPTNADFQAFVTDLAV